MGNFYQIKKTVIEYYEVYANSAKEAKEGLIVDPSKVIVKSVIVKKL